MFEAIPIRTNEVDGDWELKYFEAAFAPKPQSPTSIGAGSQAPAAPKYIRSSALPAALQAEIEQAYADILGNGEFVYVTIHQDLANLRRKARNPNLPAPRLGKRLIDLFDGGCPLELAYEDIFKDFFACLERELRCYVRSVRVYENNGKTYSDEFPVTHVHMCIALPEGRTFHRVSRLLHDLYSRLIYPVPLPVEFGGKREARPAMLTTRYLDVIRGRVDDEVSHPTYSVKQIVNEAVLRSRLHKSKKAEEMSGGRFQ